MRMLVSDSMPTRRSRRKRLSAFARVLVGLSVVAVAMCVWVGVRAAIAYEHLQAVRSVASELSPASFSDASALTTTLKRISDETAAARGLTGDPVWRVAESLPWVGPQLGAVSTISSSLDEIVGSLRPLAADVADMGLESFAPRDGVVDTAAFVQLRTTAERAATRSRVAATSIDRIDRDRLLQPVRDAADEASVMVTSVADAVDALSRTSALLPAMLGADGPRTYLVLFQNNAEWRSMGGLVGSVAVIRTENGRFSLTAQDSGAGLGRYDSPPLAMDADALSIYGTTPARFAGNITQVPDFTADAPLAREYWRLKTGQEVDGVIAVDPVALSYLLDAVGPVELSTGDTLTGDNAVRLLLNEVYLRYDDSAQNAFFETATAAVFDAIATRPLNPATLLSALGRAASENRVFLWSANPDDQAVLDGTTLQGALPATDATTTRFGVYVNDGTGSKMDYYMNVSSSAAWCGPGGGGKEVARLRVTLQSTAPADIAGFTPSITGGGRYGVAPGVARTVAYIYLPEGAELLESTASVATGFGGGTHQGRRVLIWTTELAAQQSVSLDVTVQAPRTTKLEVVQTADIDQTVPVDAAPLCTAG